MTEDMLLKLIGNIGVPAVICLYTLYGVNQTLKKQDGTLKELTDAINKLTTDVDKRVDEQSHALEMLKGQVRELSHKVENYLRRE